VLQMHPFARLVSVTLSTTPTPSCIMLSTRRPPRRPSYPRYRRVTLQERGEESAEAKDGTGRDLDAARGGTGALARGGARSGRGCLAVVA
jgi:hypothetical protein